MTLKFTAAIAAVTMLATAPVIAQDKPAATPGKKVIATASDVPPVVIELPAKPSVLVVDGGPGYEAVEERVKAHANSLLSDYEIRDEATAKGVRGVLGQVALAEGRWADALRYSNEVRALETKASAKATAGLIGDAYARAALAVGENSPGFGKAFEAELSKAVGALDWAVAQDALQATRGQFQLLSRDLLIGSLQGGLDPNAAAQGNKVGFGTAAGIVGARFTLNRVLPHKDAIFAVLDRRVASEATEKPDLWTRRLLNLAPGDVKRPVNVMVWDSGIDPSVFPGQLWTNAKERPNGRDDDGNGFVDDIHGIAFTTDWTRGTGSLRPVPASDVANLGDTLKLVKGSLDLQAAVDSPEAGALRQRIGSLKPDEVAPFQLRMGRVGLYLHGTATGFTSAEGNPGARLLHSRFDQEVAVLPQPIDEKLGANIAQHARDTVAYAKANGVRVVNMSWRMTEPQIAATLGALEPDPVKRRARANRIFDGINAALTDAFRSAPDILFVAGAGNEDEDVDFVRSFPAGINLPNVVTVGAVDVALQPASFTSYGSSIDLYANGFEVPSKVPGGMPIKISGTSLAAPYVTNLAAKMLAVNPRLTVAEVRKIMEDTATVEGPRKLKVINPAAAIARAKG